MKNCSSLVLALFGLLSGYYASAQDQGIKVGNIAPEIRLPTPKGDTVALSSVHAKLILIDFWASWCAPCMEEQPELKILFAKYNAGKAPDKKFEIFGVSLDSKKQAWQKAIRKYHITWTQVGDLKFWMSPVAQAYHIDALPFNVLVDSNGVIVALNLHGEELEKFVGKYLAPE